MRLVYQFKLSFFLVLLCSQVILMMPNRAEALFAACSWYNAGGTPWVYSYVEYNSWDVGTNNALEVYTVQTSPFSASALNYWGLSTGGGYAGHEAPASIGPVYSFIGEGTLGVLMEGNFFPSWGAGCVGNYQFSVPSVSIIISPSVVVVGDPATITWNSSNAAACYFDNTPLATSGVHHFTAALTDARPYTVECENQWGWGSDTAVLVVNEPTPDCPAEIPPSTPLSYNTTTFTPSGAHGRWEHDYPIDITYAAYCSGSYWRLKVTSASINIRIGVNMPPLQEITENNISCTTVDDMIDSINFHSNRSVEPIFYTPDQIWYLKQAIWAHEWKHDELYKNAFEPLFSSAVATAEALVMIPLSNYSNPFDALWGTPGGPPALIDTFEFDAFEGGVFFANDTAHETTAHPPGGTASWNVFHTAQKAVTDPILSQLITYRDNTCTAL